MPDHSIVHVEIPLTDLASGSKFYADLFGWKTESVPQMNYVTFDAAPGPGGGFVMAGDSASEGDAMSYKPGEVLIYVSTDDIEASLAKVESLGGQPVVRKTEIPGIGWFGVFADPTGNRVALFTPGNE
jgi:predicted enzyme related to lactoylglutathione lyase